MQTNTNNDFQNWLFEHRKFEMVLDFSLEVALKALGIAFRSQAGRLTRGLLDPTP